LYLSKYVSVFVSTYAELCRALRRHACLHLNSGSYLDPNKKLFAALNHALSEKLFQKSFQKPFRSTLGLSFGYKYQQLKALACRAACRQTLPGGQGRVF
jgi:hypothetical protein